MKKQFLILFLLLICLTVPFSSQAATVAELRVILLNLQAQLIALLSRSNVLPAGCSSTTGYSLTTGGACGLSSPLPSALGTADGTSTSSAISGVVSPESSTSTVFSQPTKKEVKRQKRIKIDHSRLLGNKLKKGDQIDLPLFADAHFKAVVEKIIFRSPTSFTLVGRLEGSSTGSFIWSREGDSSSIDIRPTGELYEINPTSGGTETVEQIDETKLPELIADGLASPLVGADLTGTVSGSVTTPSIQADAGDAVIDVMVVYSPAARIASGSTDGMKAKIQSAIANANIAFTNSGIHAQLNLVYTYEIPNYVETGNSTTDLYRLTNEGDTFMDEVQALRNTYHADLVSFIGSNIGNVCGTGWIGPNPSYAFSVVARSCLSSYSLAHEIGHNIGVTHDRAHADSSPAYPYGYGYRNPSATWRDIMSYSPGVRLNYFSNPNVIYSGEPMGIADNLPNSADNAHALNNSVGYVAKFRVPSSDVTAPSVTISSPVSGITASGILSITARAYDDVAITKVESYIDGVLFGTDTTDPYSFDWNTTRLPNGLHSLMARAYDAAGHSTLSGATSVTTANVVDTTAPTTTITSPANGTTYTSAQTITLTASAGDNVGIAKVEFYDGTTLKSTVNTAPYTYAWSLTTTANGTHQWTTKAYDAAGNSTVSSPVNVTVSIPTPDTIAPVTAITNPVNGATVSNGVGVIATAADNVGVTKVEFYLDGVLKMAGLSSPYLFSWDTKTTTNGLHSLVSKAYDAAGHNTSSATVKVTVSNLVADSIIPQVSITKPTVGKVVSVPGDLTISAVATDNAGVSQMTISLDTALLKTCTDSSPSLSNTCGLSSTVTSLTGGNHLVTATARDLAGNVGSSSVTFYKTPDITVPKLTITKPVAGSTLPVASKTFAISATASDAWGIKDVKISFDGQLVKDCPNTGSPTNTTCSGNPSVVGLSAGPHRVTASALDSNGNLAAAELTVTIPAVATSTVSVSKLGQIANILSGMQFILDRLK